MINILATIGPETDNHDAISFINQHTQLMRLNGSHADYDWHRGAVEKIRKVNPDAIVLLDIPGIKPRTSNAADVHIDEGEEVTFYFGEDLSVRGIPLTRQLPVITEAPETFSLNDGQHFFKTSSFTETSITGVSLSRFVLRTRKGVNIPVAVYDDLMQQDLIIKFLEEFENIDVDAYGISFVQNARVVKDVKARFPDKIIISKLENTEGLRSLEEICDASDVIMIDRGDLAAEIGFENLYNGVTRISACCKKYGKPLIMATENLSTMMSGSQPSKSDIMSLGHSISVGADCIMLSEETAMAPEYRNIITWLHAFLADCKPDRPVFMSKDIQQGDDDLMWSMIDNLPKDLPFIVSSRSGKAMHKILSCNFDDIHLITDNPRILKLARLYRKGITTSFDPELKQKVPSKLIYDFVKANSASVFKNKSMALSTFVSEPFSGALADNITFIYKERLGILMAILGYIWLDRELIGEV